MESNSKNVEVILLTKSEFTKELSKRTNIHPDILRCIFDNISLIIMENIIKGDVVEFPKIGRFYLTKRKSRYGYDVATGSKNILKECEYPTCRISPSFRNKVKESIKMSI